MQQAFELCDKIENPAIDAGHALKMARGYFETLFEQVRDGFPITPADIETAEYALDETAAKLEALPGLIETVTRNVAGLVRGIAA